MKKIIVKFAYALVAVFTILAIVGATSLGSALQISKVAAIPTCDALLEGSILRQLGGAGEGPSKLCVCQSDGAGAPAYQWCSITLTNLATVICAGGGAAVCP